MFKHIPTFSPRLHILVKDSGGNLRIDKDIECHSYVKNLFMITLQLMCGPNARSSDGIRVRNTSGDYRSDDSDNFVGLPQTVNYFKGGVSVSEYGIVVGSGDTVWNFEQYCLASQLTDGTSAGHLSHGAQSNPVVSDAGAVRTVTYKRSFYNNGSASVLVREIGWYWGNCWTGFTYADIVMVLRDVLDTPITMSPAEELEVTLSIDLTYPETIS